MSIDHSEIPRPLPDRPNLRHLKDQAKDLLETGAATSITDAQFKIFPPGDYERPGEVVECTALGYALRFGGPRQRRTVTLLRERGAVE